jgi:hypothetical protein
MSTQLWRHHSTVIPQLLTYFPIMEKNRVGLCVRVRITPIVARQRLGKNPLMVVGQRLGRNVNMVTNTQATIEELLDASFSIWRVSY